MNSANGDAWYLLRDASGRVYVEHQRMSLQAGQPTRLSVGAFLARGAVGPEHQALSHLIGTLVDDAPAEEPQVKTTLTHRGAGAVSLTCSCSPYLIVLLISRKQA